MATSAASPTIDRSTVKSVLITFSGGPKQITYLELKNEDWEGDIKRETVVPDKSAFVEQEPGDTEIHILTPTKT